MYIIGVIITHDAIIFFNLFPLFSVLPTAISITTR
jgi:hypothetical protein